VESIIVSPHIGSGGGIPGDTGLEDMLIENLKLYVEGKPLKRLVDWESMAD
jgi:hypothetical protein